MLLIFTIILWEYFEMIASFNMHITYRSFAQRSGLWCSFIGSNNLALFIPVIFENDLIYYQLRMDLVITFIILAHRVWCDHLTNDTNTAVQKIYPTLCVCVCLCVCIKYVCRHVLVYEHTVTVYLCTLILYPTHG